VRPRKKTPQAEEASEPQGRDGLDVNAVVSYNLKAIRERQGWTQQEVADRIGAPQSFRGCTKRPEKLIGGNKVGRESVSMKGK